jgi:hypothetical protein
LYDVRTGSLIQTIDLNTRAFYYYVDVSERHAFMCEDDVVYVFSLESGIEVLRIPAWSCPTVRCSQRVDWFIKSYEVDESLRSKFIAGVFNRTPFG